MLNTWRGWFWAVQGESPETRITLWVSNTVAGVTLARDVWCDVAANRSEGCAVSPMDTNHVSEEVRSEKHPLPWAGWRHGSFSRLKNFPVTP